MKVVATVDTDGNIVTIGATPDGMPRLAAALLPGQSEIEITDHDISDDDPDEQVHRELAELTRARARSTST